MLLKLKHESKTIKIKHSGETQQETINLAKDKFGLSTDCVLQYIDNDKDLVTLYTEEDWQMFLSEAKSMPTQPVLYLASTPNHQPPFKPLQPLAKSPKAQMGKVAVHPTSGDTFIQHLVKASTFKRSSSQEEHRYRGGHLGSQASLYPVTNDHPRQLFDDKKGKNRAVKESSVAYYQPYPIYRPVVHNGVTCDHCHTSPIIGPRYKSVHHANFDLCQHCVSLPANRTKLFVMMQTNQAGNPALAPHHFKAVVNHFKRPHDHYQPPNMIWRPQPIGRYPMWDGAYLC